MAEKKPNLYHSLLASKAVTARLVKQERLELKSRKADLNREVLAKTAGRRRARQKQHCGFDDLMRETNVMEKEGTFTPQSRQKQQMGATFPFPKLGAAGAGLVSRRNSLLLQQQHRGLGPPPPPPGGGGAGAGATRRPGQLAALRRTASHHEDDRPRGGAGGGRQRPSTAQLGGGGAAAAAAAAGAAGGAAGARPSAQVRLDSIQKQLQQRLATPGTIPKTKADLLRELSPRPPRGAAFGLPAAAAAADPFFAMHSPINTARGQNQADTVNYLAQDSEEGVGFKQKKTPPSSVQGLVKDIAAESARQQQQQHRSLVHAQNLQKLGSHTEALRAGLRATQERPESGKREKYNAAAAELYLRHATGEDPGLRADGSRRSIPSFGQLQEAYAIARLREPRPLRGGGHRGEDGGGPAPLWQVNAKLPRRATNRTFVTTLQLGINKAT